MSEQNSNNNFDLGDTNSKLDLADNEAHKNEAEIRNKKPSILQRLKARLRGDDLKQDKVTAQDVKNEIINEEAKKQARKEVEKYASEKVSEKLSIITKSKNLNELSQLETYEPISTALSKDIKITLGNEAQQILHEKSQSIREAAKSKLSQIINEISIAMVDLIDKARNNSDLYAAVGGDSNTKIGWKFEDSETVSMNDMLAMRLSINSKLFQSAKKMEYQVESGSKDAENKPREYSGIFTYKIDTIMDRVVQKVEYFNKRAALINGIDKLNLSELVKNIGHGIDKGIILNRDGSLKNSSRDAVEKAIKLFVTDKLGKEDSFATELITFNVKLKVNLAK